MQNYIVAVCGTNYTFMLLLIVSILYKFFLHTIGLVLAFLTRNVEIDVLNNSKYIRKTLYCGTFVLIVTITIAPILSDTENVDDIIWALIVFFSVIIFLGFNFIPKVSFIMNGRMHLIEVY